MKRSSTFVLLVAATACGKDKEAPKPAPTSAPAPPPASAPTPPPAPPAPARDLGFCEFTVDGGAPNRGSGGMNNVMSLHWMAPGQQGRSLASQLLINCGKGTQLNLSSSSSATDQTVPFGPKTYAIGPTDKPDGFVVMGPDFASAKSGKLEITAWDKRHLAGRFEFSAGDHAYAGTFDLACPTPGNGICEP